MPALTRRRYLEVREECWHIFHADLHVGTITERAGNPHDTEPWEWRCGFYPGSLPGECTSGPARQLRQGARLLRSGMAGVPVEPDRRRFSGVARSGSVDPRKVSPV